MKNQTKPLRALIASAVGVAAASLSFGVHASATDGLVDIWTVKVNTVFDPGSICDSNDNCVTPAVTVYNSNKSLDWGDGGPSGLDITNSPSTTNVTTNGAAVPNVDITHRNQPITGTTLKSVDILSTLTLTPFSPAGTALPSSTITFGVKFLETPNGGTGGVCADGGVPNAVGTVNEFGCADIYVTDTGFINNFFPYDLGAAGGNKGPKNYFISFFEAGSGLKPLSSAACLSVTGSSAPCLGFETPEGRDTTVHFAALITTERISIPEPATSALLGIGLLGGLLARRRRS